MPAGGGATDAEQAKVAVAEFEQMIDDRLHRRGAIEEIEARIGDSSPDSSEAP